ncbi:helix-turn-helix domain-containing protein [Sporosarcina pasteurii]|uniref:Helicase Helix-turn-helix domain-containing protein n=1 Tax=Sporosarcina pasteurii TaxID=1474 RepID=A0A380BJ91_SPOPA|nr:helix-turn-helix domain-containing protein [Sporosarcina pasteurii]MDS9470798.1 helix-turn-helix domain-containing protein [Sporosarcina pasteurii]SUJ02330.1 Uncharacterised protein [Sporosarcina pasteurii]
MNLSTLLCVLFSKLDGEKTANAALHLLRGKRSGQTIQDVKYYDLKMFFGLLPKLPQQLFNETINELVQLNCIEIDASSILHVTESGRKLVESSRAFHFNGWDYRGREEMFFARLSLVVQTLSHFRVGQKRFMPAQREIEIQQFVKKVLSGHPIEEPNFSRQLKAELQTAFEESGMEEIQKVIFTHRLVGYQHTGWTWAQLENQLRMPSLSIKLYYIESLHLLLKTIEREKTTPFLKELAKDIKLVTHLTESSAITKNLFDKGLSLEEIAATRQLKLSTIEDHIVEIAIHDHDFPIEQFVSFEDSLKVQKKSIELETKRLRLLKEVFPQLTYFQLRLILGASMKGEAAWTSIQP